MASINSLWFINSEFVVFLCLNRFTKPGQILPDLVNFAKLGQILPDLVKFFAIIILWNFTLSHSFAKLRQILPDLLRFCQTLPDFARLGPFLLGRIMAHTVSM